MVKSHQLPLLGAVVVVVAVVAGCGGGNGGSASEAGSETSSSGGSVIKTITISETEYKLTPSDVKLDKSGTYEFRVVNKGSITHALEVEGSGLEEESEDVDAGKSTTFKVTFKGDSSYEMYCPIDGHRDQGMEGEITIGSAGAGGGGTTTDDSMDSGGGGY
jgi:uncharacterized cupredoxin-like copper-binding protein